MPELQTLRALRLSYGLSQAALARQARIAIKTVQKLEAGEIGRPSTDTVTGLCEVFQLDRPAMVSVLVPQAQSSRAG
ncbi:MAG: helix-turn-helix transcriptional regulator [Patulibacter sp.]|nr:helix-turn-helix transcriptional regulator [Patulibacter sp.]